MDAVVAALQVLLLSGSTAVWLWAHRCTLTPPLCVAGIRLRNRDSGEESDLPVAGLFFAIGVHHNQRERPASFLMPLLCVCPRPFLMASCAVQGMRQPPPSCRDSCSSTATATL